MCGIAGWVAFDHELTGEREVVQRMVDTMRARGPDGLGVWTTGRAALGHRRLAVIDPHGGAQPMTVETSAGPVTITYSGETYNFVELRTALVGRGHQFVTASDTEVVLRSYLEWGDELTSRLVGMFAFAIWDGRRDSLVMVRDRMGVKPLFYFPTSDGVLFASEPKGILAHPAARRAVDVDGLRRLVAYAMTIPGVPWVGMHEVEPGDIVTVDRAGVHVRRYWRLTTQEHRDDLPTTVEHVRELLDDAVQHQLVADVPLGILLSGGLDSSTIATLASHAPGGCRPLSTYSVDFMDYADHFVADAERAAHDAPFVAEMVARLGSAHDEIVLDARTVADPELRERVVDAYDHVPGSGDRDRSMFLLFRAVKETATVALSGESADELFGGYSWFHDPMAQRADAFAWVTACYDTYGLVPGALVAPLERELDIPGYLEEQHRRAVQEVDQLDGATEHERRMRVAVHSHLTRSLRVLLDRKDRLSMASGLEVRVPYCDHRLVEYVYNAPWSLKSFDGREKSLLRAAARPLLPPSVLDRVKSAYPSTRDPRYLNALHDEVKHLAAGTDHRVFGIVERSWLCDVAGESPNSMSPRTRNTVEWVCNLAAWLDVTKVDLCVPG